MKDKMSALFDGDLEAHEAETVLNAVCKDATLRKEWALYCATADALRGEQSVSPDFLSSVMNAIDLEPTVLAPGVAQTAAPANDGWFWQKALMPVAASITGVVAVGLVAMNLFSSSAGPGGVNVAQGNANAPIVRVVEPATEQLAGHSRDEMNRQYMFVHQATAGGGPIPGAVQYVRTVSDMRGEARK